jgi:hypothetical protein
LHDLVYKIGLKIAALHEAYKPKKLSWQLMPVFQFNHNNSDSALPYPHGLYQTFAVSTGDKNYGKKFQDAVRRK